MKKNKKSIIVTLREKRGAGKTHLKMKIKSKSQLNGSYTLEAVARFLSMNYLAPVASIHNQARVNSRLWTSDMLQQFVNCILVALFTNPSFKL